MFSWIRNGEKSYSRIGIFENDLTQIETRFCTKYLLDG